MAVDPTSLKGRARQNWLRSAASRIRNHPRQNLAQVVALGKLLIQIKAVVGRGKWGDWLHRYWPHHWQLACDAMRAARILGTATISELRKFGPSASHPLTQKQLSKSARAKVLGTESKGKKIGLESVRLLVLPATDDFDRPDEPPLSLLAALSPERAAYQNLQAILQKSEMVVIDLQRESDAVKDSPPDAVVITAADASGKLVRHTRRTLESAVAAASGNEVLRRCPKCKDDKGPDEFALSTRQCRVCERKRVKTYGKKKRAS